MTKPYILIIEDDEQIKNSIEETAHSLGYMCDWANNQEDAISLVGQKDYVTVLLDLQIPARPLRTASIDYGCNCLEHIRKIKDKETMPIIVMTTYTKEGLDLTMRLIQKGANDFISKPFGNSDRSLSQVLRENIPCLQKQSVEFTKFNGGELIIYSDQVTLAGVRILGSKAANSEIRMLTLLAQKRADGTYPKLGGTAIAKKLAVKNGAISHLARTIREAATNNLKEHNIECGRWDVLPENRKYGYHLKDNIVAKIVEHVKSPAETDTKPENNQIARQKWIREQLVENGCEFTATEMAKKWNCTKKTISRDIKPLESQGLIERIGKDTWRKKNSRL
jgi:DNA-binding response OmpR family regulator